VSLHNLAGLYRMQGRYAEAEPLYKRSLAIRENGYGPDHQDVALILKSLAGLYHHQGRYTDAEPLYKRSLAIREKAQPDHPDLAHSLNNLAALYDSEGRYAEALNLSRRAVAILGKRLDERNDRSGGDAARRGQRRYFVENVSLLASAREPGGAAESFRIGQFAATSSAAQAVAGMAARFAAGSDAIATVVRERQDLVQRWQSLDAAVVKPASKPPEHRDLADEAELRRQLAAATADLDALDALIARDFPQYAELSNPKPLELSDAQSLLAPEEAMLVYLAGDRKTWLWALRRDRAEFYELDIGRKVLLTEVTALRTRLDPDLNPGLAPFDAKRAHALYQKIIAPAASVLDGAHEVLVVADGALESLPFEVLVTKSPPANPENLEDHRDIAWLARDYALTMLPSVGSLRALRRFTSGGRAAPPSLGSEIRC
jgi:tetratricopeptide (TPR) repeat protein